MRRVKYTFRTVKKHQYQERYLLFITYACGTERELKEAKMSDFIWFIIIGVLFVLLSCVFIVLGGLIWTKQKMNLIISYHCDKVKDENKKAYCRIFGIGMIVIGIGFLLSAVCIPLLKTLFSFIPLTAGLVLGIVLIVYSIAKYNK